MRGKRAEGVEGKPEAVRAGRKPERAPTKRRGNELLALACLSPLGSRVRRKFNINSGFFFYPTPWRGAIKGDTRTLFWCVRASYPRTWSNKHVKTKLN